MQGLTSGQDEWWSLLAIDFSSAYTEQLLCTAGAEIEFADWGWVALWAALRDWTVGWRERRGCGHPLCIPSVGTQYSHVCMLFRVQDCTRHATAFSSVLRLLCCEDVVRPGASCRARAERRDETRTVRNVGASRETGLPSATQAQRVVHTRLTVVLLHKGLRA